MIDFLMKVRLLHLKKQSEVSHTTGRLLLLVTNQCSNDASLETVLELLSIEVFADEHHLVHALLVFCPTRLAKLRRRSKRHLMVHTLKDVLVR